MNFNTNTNLLARYLNRRSLVLLGVAFCAATMTACTSVMPSQVMTHSPQFEPVYPVQNARETMATGAIYVGRQSDSWFGKGRNFQVGDVIRLMPAKN